MKRITPLILLLSLALMIFLQEEPSDIEQASELEELASGEYLGSESCKHCHPQIYADWWGSFHRLNMGVPDSKQILGDFGGHRRHFKGTQSHMFQEGGRYFMSYSDIDGHSETLEVHYAIGAARHQAYLHQRPDGRLQVLPNYWNVEEEAWRDAAEGPIRDPALLDHARPQALSKVHPYYWDNYGRNYNRGCISCHASQGLKGYRLKEGGYESHFDPEINCEACHGPGGGHVQGWRDLKEQRTGVGWSALNTEESILICASCHAKKMSFQEGYQADKVVYDYFMPQMWTPGAFHVDGRSATLNYHYIEYMQSLCFRETEEKFDCSNNCHPPHSLSSIRGKTVEKANSICTRCHTEHKTVLTKHTFHQPESEGSRCVNCHMPKMQLDMDMFSTDHSIGSPLPELSRRFGIPNACNSCHEHDSPEWAEAHVQRWFGESPHFQSYRARMLERAGILEKVFLRAEIPVKALIAWLSVPGRSLVERASAADFLGRAAPDPEALEALLKTVQDQHPILRYYAANSLLRFQDSRAQEALTKLLKDPYRALRLRAFTALRLKHPEMDRDPRWAELQEEWRHAEERVWIDDPDLKSQAAMVHFQRGEWEQVEVIFQRLLKTSGRVPRFRMEYLQFLLQQRRFKEAQKQQHLLAQDDPRGLAPRVAQGFIALAQGQGREALRLFDGLIAEGNLNPELMQARWRAVQLLNRP